MTPEDLEAFARVQAALNESAAASREAEEKAERQLLYGHAREYLLRHMMAQAYHEPAPQWIITKKDADEPLVSKPVAGYLEEWFTKE